MHLLQDSVIIRYLLIRGYVSDTFGTGYRISLKFAHLTGTTLTPVIDKKLPHRQVLSVRLRNQEVRIEPVSGRNSHKVLTVVVVSCPDIIRHFDQIPYPTTIYNEIGTGCLYVMLGNLVLKC